MEVSKWQTFLFCSLKMQSGSQTPFNIATLVHSSAQLQQRLYLWNDCYGSSYFPRPRFKNPKIAIANALGTDVGEGQSGSSSPHRTMLKSGQTPGMHISLQMATATFNSRNHKRLPLLIMYIMIFFFKRVGFFSPPFFFFLILFNISHHMLRFPLLEFI